MAPTKHSSLAALASLTLLLFSPVSASEVPSLECLRTRSYELAAHSACGDEGALKHYFSTFPTDLSTGDEKFLKTLTKCYIDSGCNKEETPGQIVEAAKRCAAPAVHEHHHLGLRSLNEKGIYNHPGRLRIPVPAQPVVEARAAVTAAPVEPDVALMMSKVTAPAVLRRTDEAAETRPSPKEVQSCPTQSTGTASGKKLPCFETSVPVDVCVEGLICRNENGQGISCMYKQSGLDTAGIVMAIYFAATIALSICGLCFFCCRERRTMKKLESAAEAAKIAKEAKTSAMVANKRAAAAPASDQHQQEQEHMLEQPLMGGNAGYIGGSGGYQGVPLNNEYDDVPAPPPHMAGNTGYGGAAGVRGGSGSGSPTGGAPNPFSDHNEGHPALR
ncbi:unnamed protein product [Sordaria macrospora k-hell]|uniref:WGS project CABT00000000 data, contig 2.16 n=1 Tax=Sordaria macrospora (strain ATCC MYA-333 / DSM 997 / K(L3346) / K-hell) TaxID=771870 RepID=F7VZV9_SORMK|nr:uncharacterized protein SMAC_03765 [Sordaria macrospora k-hell]CCC11058.1 unnamed protein product [Sordaria macrospora k-hell]